MFDWTVQSLKEQLDNVSDTTRIIFAHPHYHNQKRIVQSLLQEEGAIYIRFKGENLSLEDLSSQLSQQLAECSDQTDLNFVILDECDRATLDALNAFLKTLLNNHQVPRFVVISRVVAHNVLENVQFRQQCQFIPTDDTLMLYDYAHRDPSKTLVEVRGFGSGQVYINGRQIDQWDGILPRQLFLYLADRGMVTRNDIFATFWPGIPTREATNVFHVTKRKITDILGESFTKFGSGFYRVAPQIDLHYDVINFTDCIQTSVIVEPEQAIEYLEKAISLYRAPFLNSDNEINENWVKHRQEELHEMYGEALAQLAQLKLESGHEHEALGYYLNALRILNHNEEIVKTIMKLYQKNQQFQDALELYQWIHENLQRDYGITPNTTLRALADEIQNELLIMV